MPICGSHCTIATLVHEKDTMFLFTLPPSDSSFSAETQISSGPTDGLLVQASLCKTCIRYLPLFHLVTCHYFTDGILVQASLCKTCFRYLPLFHLVSNFTFRFNIVKGLIFVADNSVSMIQCCIFILMTGLTCSLLEGFDVMLVNLSILCFYFINNYTNECLDSKLETNPTILSFSSDGAASCSCKHVQCVGGRGGQCYLHQGPGQKVSCSYLTVFLTSNFILSPNFHSRAVDFQSDPTLITLCNIF